MDKETMRYYYKNGLWTLARVDKLLQSEKITQEDYEYIIGE